MILQFVLVATMALMPSVALAWTDTFEDFTPDVTVDGQGDWYCIYGAAKALVKNNAAVAYEGDQYLDFYQDITGSSYPVRDSVEPMDSSTNYKATYYFQIGDPIGTTPEDAFSRFWWSTPSGEYATTMLSTATWYNGTLVYYIGTTAVNTGVLINQGEWYKYEYTYDLASTVNWVVTRTADSSVALDVNLTTEVSNQTGVYSLEWNPGTYSPGSSWHSLLDSVSLTPDYIAEIPGDANDDQKVTDADYTIWADTYGSTTDLRADWNDSSDVTDADYTIWADNYGYGVTSVAVPEPATLSLLALGALAMIRRRK